LKLHNRKPGGADLLVELEKKKALKC